MHFVPPLCSQDLPLIQDSLIIVSQLVLYIPDSSKFYTRQLKEKGEIWGESNTGLVFPLTSVDLNFHLWQKHFQAETFKALLLNHPGFFLL